MHTDSLETIMEKDVQNHIQGLVKDGGKEGEKDVQEVMDVDITTNPLAKQ